MQYRCNKGGTCILHVIYLQIAGTGITGEIPKTTTPKSKNKKLSIAGSNCWPHD